MKKKLFSIGVIAALCATSMFIFTGCEKAPYDYDLSEYVKVGNYKGLEYKKISVSVAEKEIIAEIDDRCEKAAKTKEVKSGTVKDGDTINASYEGKIDGKTFDGGSADNQSITIGTSQMIDGFIDGLIGKKVGEKVKLDLKFPDDYKTKEVAGKDVVFEVTINSKTVNEVPKYDVDFIKANSDYDNVKDYEASVKKDLLATKKSEAELERKNTLWQEIIGKSKAKKYPEEELAAQTEKLKTAYTQIAKQNYGISYEEFIKEYSGYTEKEWNKQLKAYAESSVFQDMVLYAIAKTEKLEVTDKEFDKYLEDILKQAGMTAKQYEDSANGQTIEEWAEQEEIRTVLLLNKVMDKVVEYGKEK